MVFRRKKPEGRSVPALVVDYGRGHTVGHMPPESFKTTMRTEAIVRVDGDERRQPVSDRVTGLVFWLMAEGDTVPVLVDDSGTVVGFDRPAINELYESQKVRLKESLKPHSVIQEDLRSLGLDREQLADIGPAIRDLAGVPRKLFNVIRDPGETLAPTVDPAPAIDGVSFSTFVTVQAALVRDRVPGDRHDEVAGVHGVAPGSWAPASAAWMGLIRSDRAVGQAFGAAYAAAMKG